MILGTGTDLLDLARFEKVFHRFEKRFIARVFTPAEQKKAESRRPGATHIATYAKRFAAKEACAKALGTGFRHGIKMREIGIENNAAGKPEIILTGAAKTRLESITPAGKTSIIHLTLSDEPPLIHAQVMIEGV